MSEAGVRQRFVVLAKLFIAEICPVHDVLNGYSESVQEGFGPVFTACMKMMRGFLGLACPSPGRTGLEDVQYNFPSNASTAKLAQGFSRWIWACCDLYAQEGQREFLE